MSYKVCRVIVNGELITSFNVVNKKLQYCRDASKLVWNGDMQTPFHEEYNLLLSENSHIKLGSKDEVPRIDIGKNKDGKYSIKFDGIELDYTSTGADLNVSNMVIDEEAILHGVCPTCKIDLNSDTAHVPSILSCEKLIILPPEIDAHLTVGSPRCETVPDYSTEHGRVDIDGTGTLIVGGTTTKSDAIPGRSVVTVGARQDDYAVTKKNRVGSSGVVIVGTGTQDGIVYVGGAAPPTSATQWGHGSIFVSNKGASKASTDIRHRTSWKRCDRAFGIGIFSALHYPDKIHTDYTFVPSSGPGWEYESPSGGTTVSGIFGSTTWTDPEFILDYSGLTKDKLPKTLKLLHDLEDYLSMKHKTRFSRYQSPKFDEFMGRVKSSLAIAKSSEPTPHPGVVSFIDREKKRFDQSYSQKDK